MPFLFLFFADVPMMKSRISKMVFTFPIEKSNSVILCTRSENSDALYSFAQWMELQTRKFTTGIGLVIYQKP